MVDKDYQQQVDESDQVWLIVATNMPHIEGNRFLITPETKWGIYWNETRIELVR